jgi:hypothetical protein
VEEMTGNPHSDYRITGVIIGYFITDKSSNLYKLRNIQDAALCAARCNVLGQLDSISLYMGNGTQRFEEDITFEEMLDIWTDRLVQGHDPLSEYQKSSNQGLPEYFSKLGFYFSL